MPCKCKELEPRIEAIEDWIAEFEEGAEIAMREIEEQWGDVEVTLIPDPALMRDKAKDN
jgi:hypothetical protein